MHPLTGTPMLALPPPPPLRLIKGDALEVLPTLPSRSAGLVLTDPPYLFGSMPRVQASAAGALDGTRIDWPSLFAQLYRILQMDAAMLLFGHASTFFMICRCITGAGFRYVTDIVWVKPGPVNFLQAKMKPLSQHELVTVWRKGGLRYNWLEAKSRGLPPARQRAWRAPAAKGNFYDVRRAPPKADDGSRYMTDVLFAPNKCHFRKGERTPHPTQKPLGLVKRLVQAFSYPGDSVLDPFLGSGTTMAACRELGRACTGIEINEGYLQMAADRLGSPEPARAAPAS